VRGVRRSAGCRTKWPTGLLPDPQCRKSDCEAHHKDGCGHHGDHVNGPRVVAFTDKLEVPRAVFVSIDTKVHSGLRLHSDKAPTCLSRISPSPAAWGCIDGSDKRFNASPGVRALSRDLLASADSEFEFSAALIAEPAPCRSGPYRHHFALRRRRRALAIGRPVGHEPPPLLPHVAAAVGRRCRAIAGASVREKDHRQAADVDEFLKKLPRGFAKKIPRRARRKCSPRHIPIEKSRK
jgi:hypothetical protein